MNEPAKEEQKDEQLVPEETPLPKKTPAKEKTLAEQAPSSYECRSCRYD